MGLPGKRLSRSSKRRRASHFALKKQIFVICKKCEKKTVPHQACPHCGTYKGRQVIKLKTLKLKNVETPVTVAKETSA